MVNTVPAGARFDFATATEIRFGRGRVAELPDILGSVGISRVMVLTGANPARAAGVMEGLRSHGLGVESFAVAGEPSVDLVREAVAAALAGSCDAVIGYGGGSVLDTAKAVAALAASGSDPLEHLEVVGEGRPLTTQSLPCVAVPTTAGTGSEVTRNSVLSAGDVKASLRSPLMLPRVALVDPDLLAGQPPATVAASGSDALSQLIEPFLSARANPLTDALVRDGIPRSARSLRRAWQGELDTDPAVREDLALASLFGGLCLANSGLGAVHGFAAVLGARYGAPHGAVCAALLPAAVGTNLAAARRRDPAHPLIARIEEVASLLTGRPEVAAEEAVSWLASLRTDLNVPGLGTYGMVPGDFPAVVAQGRKASSMKANPVDLDDDELTRILVDSS